MSKTIRMIKKMKNQDNNILGTPVETSSPLIIINFVQILQLNIPISLELSPSILITSQICIPITLTSLRWVCINTMMKIFKLEDCIHLNDDFHKFDQALDIE